MSEGKVNIVHIIAFWWQKRKGGSFPHFLLAYYAVSTRTPTENAT